MTVGSLVAYQIGDDQDGAVVAATMLLTTLSLFHVVGGAAVPRPAEHDLRPRRRSRASCSCGATALALLAIVARSPRSTSSQRIFGTTGLSFNQWCICVGIAASLVVVEELIKLVLRHRGSRHLRRSPPQLSPSAVPA